ncbi:MAG: helix-hairpin-helix domain-containing protein [Bacteroidales bacterium]|nr:helix-hairpin-helix domain-containing protein [Bacteroidales bacterium]
MDSLRKWFSFSKGERVAIITILALILLLILACLFRPSRKSLSDESLHNLDSLLALRQAAIELQQQQQAEKPQEVAELHPFPFNPNTLTEEEWLQMGLTDHQVRGIMNYRAKGGKFYSKSDVAKLYTISEEEFAQLEPFIVLPEVSRGKNTKTSAKSGVSTGSTTANGSTTAPVEKKAIPIVDLNTVDSTTLVELPQIGPYTAVRIIEFREKLGGFVDKEQLRDVKGMDDARFAAIQPYINVGVVEIRKVDVNCADFKTLVHHPYLSYEQVKRIVNQREKRGMIKNWAQLEELIKEEGEVNPLLEHYLKF